MRAVYLIPFEDEPRPGETCEQLSADFSSKEVPCKFEDRTDDLKAGQRRWVEEKNLPLVADGGCSVVNVLFDPSTSVIEQVYCNGEA